MIFDKNEIDNDDETVIDSVDLLESISGSSRFANSVRYSKRRLVFIISPDPFEEKLHPLDVLRYGFKVASNSAFRGECPIMSYSIKLALFGFNQWTLRTGAISNQQLFDMQVSLMLKCNYIAVYCNGDYTDSMNRLLDIARMNHISRIDIRSV